MIQFRSVASVTPAVRTNTTISVPTGVADNDILLMGVSTGEDLAITPPAGWTLIGSDDHASVAMDLYVYYRRASSEPADYTITHAEGPTSAFIAAYSGCILSGDPQDTTAVFSEGTSGDLTGATITPANRNDRLVLIGNLWAWATTVNDKLDSLQEDYEDGTIDSDWTLIQNGSATVTESGGQLIHQLPASATATSHADASATNAFDFRESSITVRVDEVTNAATGALSGIRIYTNDDNWFRFLISGANLLAQRDNATAQATIATLTYDATVHKYWRISESAGVVTWWTSPDNVNWTSHGTYTHGMTITAMRYRSTAICIATETNPGRFVTGELNMGPYEGAIRERFADAGIFIGDQLLATTTATGTRIMKLSGSIEWNTCMILLREAYRNQGSHFVQAF